MRIRHHSRKRTVIPGSIQLKKIKEEFPEAECSTLGRGACQVKLKLRPKALSPEYEVKIMILESSSKVRVYVLDKLSLAKGRTKLPHVYSTEKQQLCLYSPIRQEWASDQFLIKTIVPWISDWLFNYELWLIDGKWYGGGHDEYENENLKTVKSEE